MNKDFERCCSFLADMVIKYIIKELYAFLFFL